MTYWIKTFLHATTLTNLLLAQVSSQDRYNDTSHLLDSLMNKIRYDKRVRPHHGGKPLNISISLVVAGFGKLREVDMDLSLDMFIRQFWNDPRLKHNIEDDVILSGELRHAVWLPDSYFLNLKTATMHNFLSENSGVRINQEGDVAYSTRMMLTASCHMELRHYPVDEQICNLTISSYSFDRRKVDYVWRLGKNGQPMIEFLNKELAEFTLVRMRVSKDYVSYSGGFKAAFAEISVIFVLKRRLQYAFIQIYVPTVLIVMLSWLTFWVEKDAVPARLGLGVTTMLTMVTLMGSFRSSLPKVSYIKAVDIYFMVSLLFVFCAVFEYVAVLLHSGMKEQKRKRLRQMRKRNARIFANTNKAENSLSGEESDEEEQNEGSLDTTRPRDEEGREKAVKGLLWRHGARIKKHSKDLVKSSFRKTKDVMVFAFMKNEADVIDRVCRYAIPSLYAAFNLSYILYYQFARFYH